MRLHDIDERSGRKLGECDLRKKRGAVPGKIVPEAAREFLSSKGAVSETLHSPAASLGYPLIIECANSPLKATIEVANDFVTPTT